MWPLKDFLSIEDLSLVFIPLRTFQRFPVFHRKHLKGFQSIEDTAGYFFQLIPLEGFLCIKDHLEASFLCSQSFSMNGSPLKNILPIKSRCLEDLLIVYYPSKIFHWFLSTENRSNVFCSKIIPRWTLFHEIHLEGFLSNAFFLSKVFCSFVGIISIEDLLKIFYPQGTYYRSFIHRIHLNGLLSIEDLSRVSYPQNTYRSS